MERESEKNFIKVSPYAHKGDIFTHDIVLMPLLHSKHFSLYVSIFLHIYHSFRWTLVCFHEFQLSSEHYFPSIPLKGFYCPILWPFLVWDGLHLKSLRMVHVLPCVPTSANNLAQPVLYDELRWCQPKHRLELWQL